MTASTSPYIVRHPGRGALWGLLLGLGLALWAILAAIVTFGSWLPLILIVVAGIAIGVAWSWLAPPKGAKDAPPAATPPMEPVAQESVAQQSAAGEPVGNETIRVDPDAGGSFSGNL